jgi:peptide/nickel transport system ATP-binding protein
MPLLSVEGLTKHFPVLGGAIIRHRTGLVHAVDGIDFTVNEGETLGIVGESGCGKSTTGRMVARLLQPTAGKILYRGQDITRLPERAMRPLRRDIQIVFQDPLSSLNPRMTVGSIIGAPLKVQGMLAGAALRKRVQELLDRVGLSAEHYNRYPHEFSGGQRQRVGIARALALQPKLVICDEPVSALDVSVQAQIVNLLLDLQRDLGLSYVFIAHDLAIVRQMADRVAVMYLGKIVEIADRAELYSAPRHPYTVSLLSAAPVAAARRGQPSRLILHGDLPSADNLPSGCRFRTRCWRAAELCSQTEPPLSQLADGHLVACHFPVAKDAPVTSGADVAG